MLLPRFLSRAWANAATWTGWVHPLCPPHVPCHTQRTPLSLPPWEEQRAGDGQRRCVDVFSPTFCYEPFEEDFEESLRCRHIGRSQQKHEKDTSRQCLVLFFMEQVGHLRVVSFRVQLCPSALASAMCNRGADWSPQSRNPCLG
uniref:Uncharacterized protein n=1 Tax=Noctiluca scintillans TaxID=2966 RepID=A0A7S1A8T0_NOCSC